MVDFVIKLLKRAQTCQCTLSICSSNSALELY